MEKNNITEGFTVGKLLEWIERFNIPNNAVIVMEHIDQYYLDSPIIEETPEMIKRKSGWNTLKRPNYHYNQSVQFNKDIAPGGKFHNKEDYPNFDVENARPFTEEELESMKPQYIPVFSPVFYDNKFLYLDAHY